MPRNTIRLQKHWGEWVQTRADFLGFKSNSELALSVGCSRQVLTGWMQMERPPEQMRRGLNSRLAVTLRLDPAILFSRYADFDPKEAPVLEASKASPSIEEDAVRRKVVAVAELLHIDQLRELQQMGESLLKETMAARVA